MGDESGSDQKEDIMKAAMKQVHGRSKLWFLLFATFVLLEYGIPSDDGATSPLDLILLVGLVCVYPVLKVHELALNGTRDEVKRLEAALKAHGIDPDNPAAPESSES